MTKAASNRRAKQKPTKSTSASKSAKGSPAASPAKGKKSQQADKAESTAQQSKQEDDTKATNQSKQEHDTTSGSAKDVVKINRAPVLVLWAAVTAEVSGLPWSVGVTSGKLISGWFAKAKGKSIGIYEDSDSDEASREKKKAERQKRLGDHEIVHVLGRPVPVKDSPQGKAAVEGTGKIIDPGQAERYLQGKFKDDYERVKEAMTELATKVQKDADLNEVAYHLYEKFRPSVPHGAKGWGSQGGLDLNQLRTLTVQDL